MARLADLAVFRLACLAICGDQPKLVSVNHVFGTRVAGKQRVNFVGGKPVVILEEVQ